MAGERGEDDFDLVTTRLPTDDDGTSEGTSVKLSGADMPALYLAPTYDFDDALGLLVIGNAFGELTLYSFSAVPPRTLAGSLQGSGFSELGDMELSKVPVPCDTTAPFPYSGPRYPPTDMLKERAVSWREERPLEHPRWRSDWSALLTSDSKNDLKSIPVFHPVNLIPYLGRYAYEMEHTLNYFGTLTPLVYQKTGMNVRTLFKAGGLFFVLAHDPEYDMVILPQGVDVRTAVEILEADLLGLPFLSIAPCLEAYDIQFLPLAK
ncbi:uncharacterized protein PHACADRAFT_248750 [Phanerochaete carnosa HHB-10118-sp]|uniref:Uncharacterized protein n=1 Tax=Phanerochaete carnosa (strain HHB-10118-sp) TaxID=650164 RepID=K5WRJ7_PHACS|nr:uncharacterized protein PHACADRAFT_248750 [Phanerochaete carnosa HHB-10118-sp]EKM61859.1 hypothetical protein PHACADRAFT_248750 [Phanerochaete carnosa HHB-10118-sp]